MRVPLGVSAYDLNEYNLPTVELENFYAEQKPHLGQVRLQPTPGLTLTQAAGTGVRGACQYDGLISGQIVYADGTSLERLSSGGANTSIATIASDDYRARFAASQADLVMTSGGTAYEVNASSVSSISVGNASGDIIGVAEMGQRFIFVEDGSGRFWYTGVGDLTVGASNFFTAEGNPDGLVGVLSYGETLYLFGSRTVELWGATGDQDTPFVTRPGAFYPDGVIGRDAYIELEGVVYCVTRAGLILALNNRRKNIATQHLSQRIQALSEANQRKVSLSAYEWQGHAFLRVTLPGAGCWNYDISTETWHRARTLNADTHIVDDFVSAFGKTFALGSGGIYELSNTVYTEGGAAVRRVAQALIPVQDNRPAFDSLTIYTSTKDIPASGQGSDPELMLRIARDGVVFDDEQQEDLPLSTPAAGQYSYPVTWRPLGRMRPPVCKVEVAISDPVGVTLADAQINLAQP